MGCREARLRCVVCGNPNWHARAGHEECTHCGLRVADADALCVAAAAIPVRLAQGRNANDPLDRWWLTGPGWRNAAWRHGYRLVDEGAARAERIPHAIALAVMTSPAEAEAASRLVRSLPSFPRAIVVMDATDADPWRHRFAGATLMAHPVDGDFAAQRNRLQQQAAEGWVLQLDSDEWPDATLLDALGWLVAAADGDGLQSLGLARRNMVDGAPSALFPDIQYRLNRAGVRFAGHVHERPVVDFNRTSLALHGAIEHRLTAARVRARTQIYSGMAPDGARPEDEERLLRRYDAIADR